MRQAWATQMQEFTSGTFDDWTSPAPGVSQKWFRIVLRVAEFLFVAVLSQGQKQTNEKEQQKSISRRTISTDSLNWGGFLGTRKLRTRSCESLGIIRWDLLFAHTIERYEHNSR
jgi:hypothetical protein